MISSNELDYVGCWGNKVPYPGVEYAEETLEELKNSLELFKNNYHRVKYNVCFSNSTEAQLEILDKNVAHMLGIDYKGLTSEYHSLFRKEVLGMGPGDIIKSFDLLTELVKNSDKIMEYEADKRARILNYYSIRVKCAIFEKIADLSNFNYGCINFDKDLFSKCSDKPFSGNSENFLFVESGEATAPYFMMGVLPNADNRYTTIADNAEEYVSGTTERKSLVVETLLAPSNPKCFFENQEVCIPTHLLYSKSNVFKKVEASPEEKIRLLKVYREITTRYNINNMLNIEGDYELILNNQNHQLKRQHITK